MSFSYSSPYFLLVTVLAETPRNIPILPVIRLIVSVGASTTTHITETSFCLYGMPILPTMQSPQSDKILFICTLAARSSTIILIMAMRFSGIKKLLRAVREESLTERIDVCAENIKLFTRRLTFEFR